MLVQLSVRNFAIVEEAVVTFGNGLNIITGETGAGKSVLMGALHLVLGGRSDKSAIREGAPEARVEASFLLNDTAAIDAILEEAGLPLCEENLLLVRRTVNQNGGGRCFINDGSATAQTLRKVGELLVDIHGPYDHQSLLDEAFQRDLLDAYGGCGALRDAYRTAWREEAALKQRLQALQGDSADIAQEIDRLQFAVDEIRQAGLSEADEEELVQRHDQAANAERILDLGGSAMNALMEGEGSIFDQLVGIQNQLAELARILPEAAEWRSEVQAVAVQTQELAGSMNERLSMMDADPEQLAALEARLTLVQRLKRKYGRTVAEILEVLERDQTRLDDLSTRTEQVERLTGAIAAAHGELLKRGEALSKRRAKEAARLAKAITAHLHDLGFLKAGFDIHVTPCDPMPEGTDHVEFGFAPNPGEPMRALRAIASSGEIARVMLAVKAVLSTHDRIPVLVFDEIDANIGGEVGRAVGQKLRAVSRDHQVLCITHLPQSAVYGDCHYRVEKRVEKGRTRTSIRRLDEAERVDEIARMLGGKDLTSVVEAHARELLAGAEKEG